VATETTPDPTPVLWGTGYGDTRHVVDGTREAPSEKYQPSKRRALSICSPDSGPAVVRLDYFADDDTPNPHDWSRDEKRNRTYAETVMRLKPCKRCLKRAGIEG
jgi:hypothetical protein